ncbi:MAG: carbohydrate ABC transporter permease [Bacilli bacterium]|nr:carbohydrate ABC transporter permease [Bacilli bacterium]
MKKDLYASSMSELRLVLKDEHVSLEQRRKAGNVGKVLTLIFTYIFLAFVGLIMIFPFYWMIITSLKTGAEIQRTIPTFWPQTFRWENYADALSTLQFGYIIRNTLIVGIFSTLGTLVTTILAAFAFARLEFKGKNVIFMILLATMMIPGEMMVISNYQSVSLMGLTGGKSATNSYIAMIIPFMISVFYIYLLRQNFKQIPNELYLAAKVDGKSDWQFLWKVMVPLAMPTLTTILILKLMGTWNAYKWPALVVSGNEQLYLITNALRDNFQANDPDSSGKQMAAVMITTLPLILVFIFARKYIMKGVSRAGIKG